jgi:hypothetical protein
MADGFFERRLAAAVERLTEAGYTETFRGEAGGIRAATAGHLHPPEELVVEAIERFEGVSDPEDEAIVLALRSSVDGCRGTYTAPYGEAMPPLDAELIARIPDARKT